MTILIEIERSAIPGIVYINVPENLNDKYVTVLKLQLDGPISMYKGTGGL
jgi:alpha-L-fucosidase